MDNELNYTYEMIYAMNNKDLPTKLELQELTQKYINNTPSPIEQRYERFQTLIKCNILHLPIYAKTSNKTEYEVRTPSYDIVHCTEMKQFVNRFNKTNPDIDVDVNFKQSWSNKLFGYDNCTTVLKWQ